MLDHVMPVCQGGSEVEILFNQYDGQALVLEGNQDFAKLLHNHRGKPFGDFIQQEHVGSGAQDAGHGEHLLLATRQLGALAEPAFIQVGEHVVDFFQAHAATAHHRWQCEVFLNVKGGKMPRCSGQYPTPNLAMWCGAQLMVSSPLIMMEPVRRPTMFMIALRVVLRPAPLRPSRVTNSPRFTTRSMP